MFNWIKASKISFVSIVILLMYIPLFFLLIFSFNATSRRGVISFDIWNGLSFQAYVDLFSQDVLLAFANSAIIAFFTIIITTILSLLTVFGLWKQKNKAIKLYTDGTNNIPIINADIITAIGIAILLTSMFGTLVANDEGIFRAIISHVVMTFPYSILIMYPRSEKFNETLFKASYDLGYGKIRTWFKTYFRYMLLPIIFSIIITTVFSFDDFILARISSNVQTVGVQLFAGQFQPWALALGSLLLIAVIIGNIIYVLFKISQAKKAKKTTSQLIKLNATDPMLKKLFGIKKVKSKFFNLHLNKTKFKGE
ncbi:ABC transporter permease [[Mycoplasma] mobile]|uniref:Spermidine/putrescine ABC transporter permease protein n=1 Tax=Mycoplasma mobile (strain ATCC 43663 / 163K / NCTC 11711) TaxID=267748 RepID=Q6KIP0_MYCM1|nr:ABC transporter permease subunit [[Mycoplasma] mobile]AAT27536.1 spermidine/putrescine ABC transporter permease protein [Mycoplasma mobile 163K]